MMQVDGGQMSNEWGRGSILSSFAGDGIQSYSIGQNEYYLPCALHYTVSKMPCSRSCLKDVSSREEANRISGSWPPKHRTRAFPVQWPFPRRRQKENLRASHTKVNKAHINGS